MKQIHKQLLWKEQGPYEMPEGAEILSIQIQKYQPVMWYLCDPLMTMEERFIVWYGTGDNIPTPENLIYIGTVQDERIVKHF